MNSIEKMVLAALFSVLPGFSYFFRTLSGKIKTRIEDLHCLNPQVLFFLLIINFFFSANNVSAQDSIQIDTISKNEVSINVASTDTTLNTEVVTEEKEPVIRLRKALHSFPSYYIYVFLAAFLIIAFIRIIDPQYLSEIFISTVKTGNLFTLLQEGKFGFNIANLLLDLVFVISFSILIQLKFFPDEPALLSLIILCALGAFALKIMLIQLSAYLFFDRTDALLHILMHLHFTRLLAIILLPVIFCALYQVIFPLPVLIELIFVFLLFIYIIWLLKLLVKMKIEGISGVSYLFLYLCAIEISPVLILIKDFIL